MVEDEYRRSRDGKYGSAPKARPAPLQNEDRVTTLRWKAGFYGLLLIVQAGVLVIFRPVTYGFLAFACGILTVRIYDLIREYRSL